MFVLFELSLGHGHDENRFAVTGKSLRITQCLLQFLVTDLLR